MAKFPEKYLANNLFKFSHLLFLLGAGFLFIILIGACIEMYSLSKQQISNYKDERLKVEKLYQDKSSENLDYRLSKVEHQLESTVSDLRQESNNIINKFNAWLGFWIAILAIFGAVIPIVLQYVLKKKSDGEMADRLKDIDEYISNHQLFMHVSSVYIENECSIISDFSQKDVFIKEMIMKTHRSFEKLIEIADNDHAFLDRKYELPIINGLVQYCRLIELLRLKQDVSKKAKRQLDELSDAIRVVIENILNHSQYSRMDVWSQLIDLQPRLESLPIE